MSIKGEQQARLTALYIWLQALESAFGYEERPLHRSIMTPKSYGTSGRIKDSAWVREVQHRPGGSSLSAKISIGRGAPVRMLMKTPLIRCCARIELALSSQAYPSAYASLCSL
jgi:hypothetical protein